MKEKPEPTEHDLVARVQGVLPDDPAAVHKGPVAGAEVAHAPGVAEPLEDGVDPGDPVAVHDNVVRLERPDGHSLGVQRSKLAPARPHTST